MTIVDNDSTVEAPSSDADAEAARESGRMPGSAAAALVACGLGSAIFGLAVVLAEANETVKTALTLHEGVGPLSGKSVVGTAGYFLAWLLLHLVLRGRTVSSRVAITVAFGLVAVGLLLTFPTFYQLFAAESPAHPGPGH